MTEAVQRRLPAGVRLPWAAVAASAVLLALVLARPQALRIEAGEPGAVHALRSFGPAITSKQRACRWSGPDSVLVLHGLGAGESVVVLTVAGGTPGRLQEVSLAPVDGDRRIEVDPPHFTVGSDWSEQRLRLKVSGWPPSAEPVRLSLATSPYRRGAEGEELGVRLAGLVAQPAGWAGRLAAAALWTWMLALVAAAAVRAARRWGQPARADGVATAVVGTAGLGLVIWAWRDPYGLAWALPPPIVTLVVMTLCYAVRAKPGPPHWGLAAASRLCPQTPKAGGGATVAGREVWAWALALTALTVLYVQRGGFREAALLLAAVVAWLLVRRRRPEAAPAPRGDVSTRGIALGLMIVLAVAVAMRFALIRELPYGLWRDEARYGIVALRMIAQSDYRPAYLDGEVTLPGLGLQMLSLGLRLWGIASWSMRTVTALAGALTVIPLFGLTRRLTGRGDVALLAAAFLAASSWHVTVSRMTSPAALHPLFELSGLWCLVEGLGVGRAVPVGRAWRVVLLLAAGALIGVGMQTYHSGRVSPLVAAALVATTWAARRATGPRGLLLVAAGFAAAAAPLLVYAWTDAQRLNARATAVFLPAVAEANADAPLAALDASLGRHLLLFNVRGESNGRRNVPWRPMFDPVTGLGFLAGLLALWRERKSAGARFLLAALALGLLPGAVAVEGPHSLRVIGAAAYGCVVAAVGWHDLAGRLGTGSAGRTSGAPAMLALGALAMNAWTYFVVAPKDFRVWGSFYPVETQVGTFVRDLARREGPPAAARVYLSPEMAESPVTQFLVYGLPVKTFDDAASTPPARDALFVVGREEDQARLAALATERALGPPASAGAGPLLPDGSRPAFTLFRLP